MATFTTFLSKPPYATTSTIIKSQHTPKTNPFHSITFPANSTIKRSSPFLIQLEHPAQFNSLTPKAATSSSATPSGTGATTNKPAEDRVQKVNDLYEFDNALKAAKNRLVVVEYASKETYVTNRIYPFMVDLSRNCNDVNFILVIGDETQATRRICDREKITDVPHFTFYKNMEKIHEEEGVGPDQLVGDVLYYGDNHSEVIQLHSGEDVKKLIDDHKDGHKLIVLDVGLKHCGPCVKVYPTVIKLSRQMKDSVIFARMNGDENESCMKFLKDMDVIEVPTFLFIRDGEINGRYVGSGKGELIGEILRYQGVRVTY